MAEQGKPNAGASDGATQVRLVNIRQPDGSVVQGNLPPITDIVIPHTDTKSARIKWLNRVGYSYSEIYNFLGIKYQMVRNICTTIPKRAAREDLPPLEVQYRERGDLLQEAMDGALDASLKAGRKERKADEKQERREHWQEFNRLDGDDTDDE